MFARNRPYYRIAKANVPAPARHAGGENLSRRHEIAWNGAFPVRR